MDILSFYKGKRVLITGHTGFKGVWLSRMLVNAGAIVKGYSLGAPTMPSLFDIIDLAKMESVIADIRDFDKLRETFESFQPEIVFHLAAQPIVKESYVDPRYTYEVNVMGTVNVMECVRLFPCVKSVVNVTTDKVYRNNEWCWGYREDEMLDGFDPYSNSKSCSELVTHSYNNSFFVGRDVNVSTARAGNVIGGGDFAADRIIPDCVRAVTNHRTIAVRNPYSIRPYEHVLEPLSVYLLIAEKQYDDKRYAGYYNVGPDEQDYVRTGELVKLFCDIWKEGATWENRCEKQAPHEANILKLDCSKLKNVFGWKTTWHIEECMTMVCSFYKKWLDGGNVTEEMDRQIELFFQHSRRSYDEKLEF